MLTSEVKEAINKQPNDKLATAIGHFVRYDNLGRADKIMLNMQCGMDDSWAIKAKQMIDYVREVYEERLKNV